MINASVITAILSLLGLWLRFRLGQSNERDKVRAEMTEAFLEDFNNVQAIDAALAGHGDTEWLERMQKKWGFTPGAGNSG